MRLIEVLPGSRVLFAVKANPAPEVLKRLADVGSSFDVASPGEIERCLKLGIDPARSRVRQHHKEGEGHRLRRPERGQDLHR